MTAMDYFFKMHRLHEEGSWFSLEALFKQEHPVLPTEREAFLEMAAYSDHNLKVRLDGTGLHVIPKE